MKLFLDEFFFDVDESVPNLQKQPHEHHEQCLGQVKEREMHQREADEIGSAKEHVEEKEDAVRESLTELDVRCLSQFAAVDCVVSESPRTSADDARRNRQCRVPKKKGTEDS